MRFLSVCSGIEAASVAWEPLGWKAAAVAEIDPFPAHVLHQRFGASRPLFMPDPESGGLSAKERRARSNAIKAVSTLPLQADLPNLGDMTQFKEWPDVATDLLVGGTPCQSFSVAGLRKGMDDPRGNLALTYLAIAARYRPRWLVWENVPGVLSSNGGRDFGSFLGGLVQLGYGFAYRVLDAQYIRTCALPFAVPQRRRRVFVVGYLGDWRAAAAALFDGQSLRGEGFDASEDGTGRGTPLVPEVVATRWAVRRLSTVECCRLQGFPEGHTRIAWRGKPPEKCPDGPQYKALGNSMATNVMGWLGERIQMVEYIINENQ